QRAPQGEGRTAQRPAGGQRAPQGEGRTAQRPAGGQRAPGQGKGQSEQAGTPKAAEVKKEHPVRKKGILSKLFKH
ncbi:MAG: hypothetical protein K9M84_13795, partial [Spirochaetia bacterium]|nr:hypothetical protein [Spirochaetia bacterium]